MNPGGGSGWDEPPLDIQIPDDARELERDVIAYHRELRARRRRRRLRRLTAPFSGPGTVMPLLASILAVCLVAGVMLSVATFSPATGPEHQGHPSATAASGLQSAAPRSGARTPAGQASGAAASGTATSGTATSGTATSGTAAATTPASGATTSTTATSGAARPSASAGGSAQPSGSANASARSAGTTKVPAPSGAP